MQKTTPKTGRMQREKMRRMEDILQAAHNVMLVKSYTGATMDDIAAEAGLTKPTIYQYFKTKDELFVALIEPHILAFKAQLDALKTAIDEGKYKSGRQIIHDAYNVYYSTFESDPDLCRLFIIFLNVGMKADRTGNATVRMRELGKMCFISGHSIAQACVGSGFFREVDIRHATDFVWASFWGIVQVEQYKWIENGISPFLKPVLTFCENMLITALVKK
ncbi:MAG TPA: TetR/AcrR family transcriptional regulator [Spirochaetota bacterium]|nr:TetR/AcrR family transcriptional regulator [Spirochaetota bacterium]HQO39334.1 TetR/AcrR family transcriptional regulator [Spirochaetota bacterium]